MPAATCLNQCVLIPKHNPIDACATIQERPHYVDVSQTGCRDQRVTITVHGHIRVRTMVEKPLNCGKPVVASSGNKRTAVARDLAIQDCALPEKPLHVQNVTGSGSLIQSTIDRKRILLSSFR